MCKHKIHFRDQIQNFPKIFHDICLELSEEIPRDSKTG